MASNTTVIKKAGCFFRHKHCGVLVHVRNGMVVKVRGNPDHPISRGFICERALRAPKWLYHKDQLRYPLTRFMNLFGNPQNNMDPGTICAMNCLAIDMAITGSMNFRSDLANSKCVVLWGINPAETRLTRWALLREKIRRKEIKVIIVDPRLTKSAEYADITLQLRPGTDAALALGWVHVIINEDLYDKDFVEQWTHGFEELRERVREYNPQRVAGITGLAPDDIIRSARMYAETKPACIERGVASDQLGFNSGRVEQVRVILRAITGNMVNPIK